MKNILLATTLLVPQIAFAESYYDGGIKWTLFSGKVAEDIYIPEGQEIDKSISSLIIPESDRVVGYDKNRINSLIPYINIDENKDYGRFGATLEGFYPYRTEITDDVVYWVPEQRLMNVNKPIPLYEDLAEIKQVPLFEINSVNSLKAEVTVISDADKKYLLTVIPVFDRDNDFTKWGSKRNRICYNNALINGEEIELKIRDQEQFAFIDLKEGANKVEITAWCLPNYKGKHRENDTGYTYRGSYGYDDGFTIHGLGFRFVDSETQTPLGIKNYQKAEEVNITPEGFNMPVLHVWENIGKSDFIAPNDLEFALADDVKGVWSDLKEFDFTDIELISPNLQEYDLEDDIHSKRLLVKGTFYPKAEGQYEILVLKRSNIVGYSKNRTNFGNNEDGYFMQPVYSLALDYGKPVAHSKKRDTSVSDIPIEYDWFFFDVDMDDINFGMDMSFYAKGVVGATSFGAYKNIIKMTPSGGFLMERLDALNAGIPASQRMAVYIKAPNEREFRPLQHSDFYAGDVPVGIRSQVDGVKTSQDPVNTQSSSQTPTGKNMGLNDLDAFAFE